MKEFSFLLLFAVLCTVVADVPEENAFADNNIYTYTSETGDCQCSGYEKPTSGLGRALDMHCWSTADKGKKHPCVYKGNPHVGGCAGRYDADFKEFYKQLLAAVGKDVCKAIVDKKEACIDKGYFAEMCNDVPQSVFRLVPKPVTPIGKQKFEFTLPTGGCKCGGDETRDVGEPHEQLNVRCWSTKKPADVQHCIYKGNPKIGKCVGRYKRDSDGFYNGLLDPIGSELCPLILNGQTGCVEGSFYSKMCKEVERTDFKLDGRREQLIAPLTYKKTFSDCECGAYEIRHDVNERKLDVRCWSTFTHEPQRCVYKGNPNTGDCVAQYTENNKLFYEQLLQNVGLELCRYVGLGFVGCKRQSFFAAMCEDVRESDFTLDGDMVQPVVNGFL